MLIAAFVHVQPEGHQEPHNEDGSLSLAACLAGFEPWMAVKLTIHQNSSISKALHILGKS